MRVRRQTGVAIALGLAVVAFVAVLIATKHGPGTTPDSAVYLSGAQHLANGAGLVDYRGGLLTQFPPGFSAILAAAHKAGVTVETGARFVNTFAFAATVILGYVLLRRHVRSTLIVVAGTVAIAISPVLLRVSAKALSEPLFTVVVLLFILALEQLLADLRTNDLWTVWFVAAVGLVWIAFLLRYAGIALVVTGAVVLFLASNERRWRNTAVFLVAALIIPGLWVIRNVSEGTGAFGERSDAIRGIGTNAWQALDALSRWLVPHQIPTALRVIALVVGVGLAVWILGRHVDASLLPLAVWVVCSLAYLVISASVTVIDRADDRLLSPTFVPLIVLAAVAVDLVPDAMFRRVIAVGFVIWLAWSGATFVKAARDFTEASGGYAAARWQQSPLLARINRLPSSTHIESNLPDAIYLVDHRDASFSPASVNPAAPPCQSYLAWFPAENRSFLATRAQVNRRFPLQQVARTRDGTLYQVMCAS